MRIAYKYNLEYVHADEEDDEVTPPLKPLSKSAATAGKAAAAKPPVKKAAAASPLKNAAKEKLFKARHCHNLIRAILSPKGLVDVSKQGFYIPSY